jgi:hypothetical protein
VQGAMFCDHCCGREVSELQRHCDDHIGLLLFLVRESPFPLAGLLPGDEHLRSFPVLEHLVSFIQPPPQRLSRASQHFTALAEKSRRFSPVHLKLREGLVEDLLLPGLSLNFRLLMNAPPSAQTPGNFLKRPVFSV